MGLTAKMRDAQQFKSKYGKLVGAVNEAKEAMSMDKAQHALTDTESHDYEFATWLSQQRRLLQEAQEHAGDRRSWR